MIWKLKHFVLYTDLEGLSRMKVNDNSQDLEK